MLLTIEHAKYQIPIKIMLDTVKIYYAFNIPIIYRLMTANIVYPYHWDKTVEAK